MCINFGKDKGFTAIGQKSLLQIRPTFDTPSKNKVY